MTSLTSMIAQLPNDYQKGQNTECLKFDQKSRSIIIQMFLHERLPAVGVRVLIGDREENLELDVEIDQVGQLNLNVFLMEVRELLSLQKQWPLFFFDHSLGTYTLVGEETLVSAHFTAIICENTITLKCEPRLSDQMRANPPRVEEEHRVKRSRERLIEEAFVLVEQWRYLYREGTLNQQGKKVKCTLDQSAQLIGIPRKTLEDYFLTFRIAKTLNFDFPKHRNQRIGVLRAYLRENPKAKPTLLDESTFFKQVRIQLLGLKPEEQLFNILKSNRSGSSSDEDMIFQN